MDGFFLVFQVWAAFLSFWLRSSGMCGGGWPTTYDRVPTRQSGILFFPPFDRLRRDQLSSFHSFGFSFYSYPVVLSQKFRATATFFPGRPRN